MKINFKTISPFSFNILVLVILNSNICISQIIKNEYYKSGKIFRSYVINKDSLNNGFDKYYFENGKISEKKNWSEGQLTDSLFAYNEKGEIISKGFVNKNKLLKLYKNDILYYEGLLDKDKLRGIVVYFKNDDIVLSKTFKENKENGFGVLLDDKSLKPRYIYEANNDIRDGVLVDFYENGVVKSFRTKSLQSDNAQFFEFYSTGILKSIGYKSNGVYVGYVYYFREDGKLEKKIFYKDGEIIQEWFNDTIPKSV